MKLQSLKLRIPGKSNRLCNPKQKKLNSENLTESEGNGHTRV